MELWLDYLEVSIMASVAMAGFILLSAIFNIRYQKKYRMLVWVLIMIRLLLPFNFQLWGQSFVTEVPVYTIAEYNTAGPEEREEQISGETVSPGQINTASDNGQEISITTGTVVTMIWMAGIVVFLGYHLFIHKRAYGKIEKCSYVCNDERILLCAQRIAGDINLKRMPSIRILEGEKKSPFSMGILYNTIYLPEQQYVEKDVMYIVRHEMIHCKNHDILLKTVMLVVNAIHWFNPLVWLMRMLVAQDMELICDEEVLGTASREECREYSEIIMSCISTDSPLKRMISTSYVQGTRFMKYRFQNIFARQKKKGGVVCAAVVLLLMLLLQGKVQVAAKQVIAAIDVPVCFGIELKADVDGDGKNDRVYVKDQVGSTEVYTQLIVQLANGKTDFINYPDYWGSYLISGDLDNDGASDIVLMRGASGSAYGLGYVNVLHIVDGQWEEYPEEFIKNPSILLEQPDDFTQRPLGDGYVAATIVKKDGKTLLRLIRNEDIGNDMVSCIDCFWTGTGWQIEDMQLVENYYGEYKDLELLENNFNYD